MKKIRIEYDFTYFMDESLDEENEEYANYKIDINEVKLSKLEIDETLLYIKENLKKEIGHFEIKETETDNLHIVNIKTDQVEAEDIIPLLNQNHSKLKILFKNAKVEEIEQIGNNDLAYNTKKLKR